MAKRQSVKQEIKTELLKGRLQEQRSKVADQRQDKIYIESAGTDFDKTKLLEKQYFYREDTYNACLKCAVRFVDWVREESGLTEKRLPIREYSQYIEDYIQHRIDSGEVSPRTIAKERSQLSKVWLVDTDHIQILPCKTESDKGRTPDKHYDMQSERNISATEFYTMIGARKGEYRFINDQEFTKYQEKINNSTDPRVQELHLKLRHNSDGQCPNIYPIMNKETHLIDKVVVIHAKHGKTNVSEILPEHQKEITRIFVSQEYRYYFYPSDHCNVHQCRRDYARALYEHYARPIETLSRTEKFICRDGTHRQYDREALSKVAQSLGHTPNDLFDTVHNYLR